MLRAFIHTLARHLVKRRRLCHARVRARVGVGARAKVRARVGVGARARVGVGLGVGARARLRLRAIVRPP